jgi:hypothetical protein
MESNLAMRGTLVAKRISPKKAPLSWKLSNILSTKFLSGLLSVNVAKAISKLTGFPIIVSELAIKVRHNGEWIDYGVVSNRVVTNLGVAFLVDAWDNRGTNLEDMNYHGCGTGTNAEDVTDSALQTECTTALNPDSTRATGTRSQPTAPQYRTIGTLVFDTGAAVTEHGLLSQAATGGGVLWDRSVFAAINVASADSIQFTYTCTVTAGS